jgi:hypothetical protein
MKNIAKFLVIGMLFASHQMTNYPATAAAKPKCTGSTLKSYQKNLRLYNKQWTDLVRVRSEEEMYRSYGLFSKWLELESLSESVWYSYGSALETYAKKCKMKMPQEWQDARDEVPDL